MTGAEENTEDKAPELLIAELLYASPIAALLSQIQARLPDALPNAKIISKADQIESILIAHQDNVFELASGEKIPALTAILAGNSFDPTRLDAALQQTWDWPGAAAEVRRARHQIAVTEMMARVFEPQIRVRLFRDVLLEIIKLVPPLAIHCHHAEKIADPAKIVEACAPSSSAGGMAAFLNVRLFRIENRESGELVMDTRGLAALGLPDIQVHFRKLDARQVAALLFNTALYVYEKGDCIEDGHTVQGLAADQKWRCQHEESLVAPKRVVVDLDPGDPFAAGRRRRGRG
jgi:hypothetical protein